MDYPICRSLRLDGNLWFSVFLRCVSSLSASFQFLIFQFSFSCAPHLPLVRGVIIRDMWLRGWWFLFSRQAC